MNDKIERVDGDDWKCDGGDVDNQRKNELETCYYSEMSSPTNWNDGWDWLMRSCDGM